MLLSSFSFVEFLYLKLMEELRKRVYGIVLFFCIGCFISFSPCDASAPPPYLLALRSQCPLSFSFQSPLQVSFSFLAGLYFWYFSVANFLCMYLVFLSAFSLLCNFCFSLDFRNYVGFLLFFALIFWVITLKARNFLT